MASCETPRLVLGESLSEICGHAMTRVASQLRRHRRKKEVRSDLARQEDEATGGNSTTDDQGRSIWWGEWTGAR
jgi:hypothetical protein